MKNKLTTWVAFCAVLVLGLTSAVTQAAGVKHYPCVVLTSISQLVDENNQTIFNSVTSENFFSTTTGKKYSPAKLLDTPELAANLDIGYLHTSKQSLYSPRYWAQVPIFDPLIKALKNETRYEQKLADSITLTQFNNADVDFINNVF